MIRMESHFIEGHGGMRLHVREAGRSDGPAILFLHGWSQSWLSWLKQMEDAALASRFRLLAMDLRGHGMSGRTAEDAAFMENRPWADDVQAILSALDVSRAVLVGWSYGGSVVLDHLSTWGTKRVSGIVLVAPAVLFSKADYGRWYGPGLLKNAVGARSADLGENIAAMRGLLHACIVRPVDPEWFETQLAASMVVPPRVRGAMTRKRLDYETLLRRIDIPVMLVHGLEDRVVLPAVSRTLAGWIPRVRMELRRGVGHCPFAEEPERFNAALTDFVTGLQAADRLGETGRQ